MHVVLDGHNSYKTIYPPYPAMSHRQIDHLQLFVHVASELCPQLVPGLRVVTDLDSILQFFFFVMERLY